MYPFAI